MNVEIFKVKKGIKFISITNDVGLEVVLSTIGASIYSIKFDVEQMNLTPKVFDDFYHSGKYYGKTIGRIAGRVKNGLLKVNDKEYQLSQNEGLNCLHGGKDGLSEKVWLLQVKRMKEGVVVTFHATTKNGESGFNGKCEYRVAYAIPKDENNINIKYYARCFEDTYFNLTNHTYFNLANQKDILNHRLLIKASEVSTFDFEDFTINGLTKVDNTVFDFREPKLIKKDISNPVLHENKWLNGYDHRFKFDEVDNDENEAKVVLDYGNYKLNIYTDYDAVHVYTSGFSNDDTLITDDKDVPFKGIALECSNFEPTFKQSKESYQYFIKYKFRRKSDE